MIERTEICELSETKVQSNGELLTDAELESVSGGAVRLQTLFPWMLTLGMTQKEPVNGLYMDRF